MSAPVLDRVVVVNSRDDGVCPGVPLVEGDGEARAVIWPGMGASERTMHRVRLGAGASTVALRHPGEAVWYVVSGDGTVADPEGGQAHPVVLGSMVHTEPGDPYRFTAGADGLLLVGGPCPADPALYAHLEEA